jgi:hypothetical protein
MIKSKFVLDILDLMLDGDVDGLTARPQMKYLTDEEYEYTGGGLFVSFTHSAEILQYKTSKDNLILMGVKITTLEFPIEADATLFFKNGIIDYLEVWCYLGDYPGRELTKYTLTQYWTDSPGKSMTTESDREV